MNTISGLSFYDSLNKMTIGALVLLLFSNNIELYEHKFLWVVTAFFVGCIFQMIVQFITGNTLLSKGIKIGFKNFFAHDCSRFHKINDLFNWTNNKTLIKEACNDLYGKDYIDETYKNIKNDNYISEYYLAYYRVAKNNILMNIPILEALENFMRNLIFYFLFVIFSSCCLLATCSCKTISIIIICGALVFMIFVFLFSILSLVYSKHTLIFELNLLGLLFCGFFCVIFLYENIDISIIDCVLQKQYLKLTLCFVAILNSCWLRREIQYKIHYLIWEGDYYIRRLDKERNKA